MKEILYKKKKELEAKKEFGAEGDKAFEAVLEKA
jgi:hypothetical protein